MCYITNGQRDQRMIQPTYRHNLRYRTDCPRWLSSQARLQTNQLYESSFALAPNYILSQNSNTYAEAYILRKSYMIMSS